MTIIDGAVLTTGPIGLALLTICIVLGVVSVLVVSNPPWDGLGLLPYAFLPHYRSHHPESAAIQLVATAYRNDGTPFRPVRDGEVITIDSRSAAWFPVPEVQL